MSSNANGVLAGLIFVGILVVGVGSVVIYDNNGGYEQEAKAEVQSTDTIKNRRWYARAMETFFYNIGITLSAHTTGKDDTTLKIYADGLTKEAVNNNIHSTIVDDLQLYGFRKVVYTNESDYSSTSINVEG